MSHVTIITRMAPSAKSSVWFLFRSCFSAFGSKINHFGIHKKCYFPVKFVVSLIIFVNDCRNVWPFGAELTDFSFVFCAFCVLLTLIYFIIVLFY